MTAAAAKGSPWKEVGDRIEIDVPVGFGSFKDTDKSRPGLQIDVQVYRSAVDGRIRFATPDGVVVGESPDGGFTPEDSLGAGGRAFAWGDTTAGTARLWTPAFDAGRTLLSVDPSLRCGKALDKTTPLAGPFSIAIPAGAKPGGRDVANPASVLVYGDLRDPDRGVRIATAGGVTVAQRKARPIARGGFVFAGAVFAYGTNGRQKPKLWTPELDGQSTDLVQTGFVGCIPAAQTGTITVTKTVVPASDPGRFDLQIDGSTKAAGVGNGGTTGSVTVPAGTHSVSEVASAGASLADYTSTIDCVGTNDAEPVDVAGSGLASLPVDPGDDWRCTITNTRNTGTITVTNALDPGDDPGRFDLEIDGQTKLAAAGNDGTTGPVALPTGLHSVSVAAAPGTHVDDYTTGIVCTEDSNPASPLVASGGTLDSIPVQTGDAWQCAVTSRRTVDLATVTPQAAPDTSRAVSKTIGKFGGTIDTDGADGTHYHFVVPAGALAADTEITVAPASVSGLDDVADDVTAGVDFAPDGLTFALPANLTITLPGPAGRTFAATFHSGAAGISFLLPSVSGNVVSMDVEHFSDVATLHARVAAIAANISSALANAPELDSPQLARLIAAYHSVPSGDPGGTALGSFLLGLYTSTVAPAIAAVDTANARPETLDDWEVAQQVVRDFGGIVQLASSSGDGRDLPSGDPSNPKQTLHDVAAQGVADVTRKGETLLAAYSAGGGPSACSAAVDGVADWVALPDRLAADLQLLGAVGGFSLCLGTHVETLTHFPGTIDSSVENVSASFQASVTAPAQTPGGVASGGQMLFPEPSEYVLTVQGGTFQGGGTSLDTTSGDDGALSVQIDRGADPTTRAARVTVDGTVIVGDLGLVVQTHGGTNQVAVHETAGPQSATQVSFAFSPPVNSILDPGGTTNLCVKVTDAESKPIENLSVSWALGGPGSLAAPSSTTDATGVACVDYHHPAGPVAQGDTATITATATHDGADGSDSVTLTPRWVSIRIEAKPDSQSGFTTATNGTVPVVPGEHAQLRLTLTGPGATVSDPPQPLRAGSTVQVEIDTGGGTLVLPDGTTGVLALPTLDTNGQTLLTWDPQSSTVDTRIHVSFPLPDVGPGVGADVLLAQRRANVVGLHTGTIHACGFIEENGRIPFCQDSIFQERLDLFVTATLLPDGTISVHVTGTVSAHDSENDYVVAGGELFLDCTGSYDFDGSVDNVQVLDSGVRIVASGTETDTRPHPICGPPADGQFSLGSDFDSLHGRSLDILETQVVEDQSGNPVALDFNFNGTGSYGDVYVETGTVPIN